MKLVLRQIGIVLLLVSWGVRSPAQGFINFETADLVRNASDGTVLGTEGYLAQLFVSGFNDPHQMFPIGGVAVVGANGIIQTPSPNNRSVPGFPSGRTVFAQIRVWNQEDNFSFEAVRDFGGYLGLSQVFRVELADSSTSLLSSGGAIHVHKVIGNKAESGQIRFANRGLGWEAPFFDVSGKRLEGDTYVAQLYAGPSEDFLNPVSDLRTFVTGSMAGFLVGGAEICRTPLVHPGETAYAKIVVWEKKGGPNVENAISTRRPFGQSNIVRVLAGGGFFPEFLVSDLNGLESVWLEQIEEPTTQGSVHFANRFFNPTLGQALEFRVFMPDGRTPVNAEGFFAQLYAGFDPLNLGPVGWPKPFLSGENSGIWEPEVKLIPGSQPGAIVYTQVKVWNNKSAETYETAESLMAIRGESDIMSIKTGGDGIPPSLPPPLLELKEFVLYTGSKPVITSDLKNIGVIEGEPVLLEFGFNASEPIQIDWLFNNIPILAPNRSSLSIPSAEPDHAGIYQAIVRNSAGQISTSKVEVTVSKRIDPPRIVSVSGDMKVGAGTSPMMSIELAGTPPFNVDWYLDGVLLLKNAGPQITLGNANAQFGGQYSVTVSNA